MEDLIDKSENKSKRKDEPYIILQIKYLTNSFCSLQ